MRLRFPIISNVVGVALAGTNFLPRTDKPFPASHS